MYKLALCWKYLLTRYLALACVISVMLGVATLIVVNSVMSGFSTKLKDRLHGLFTDMSIESWDPLSGFPDPEERMKLVWADPYLREQIEAMTPTIEVVAIIRFKYGGQLIPRRVTLIGIDAKERNKLGGFSNYLVNTENRVAPSFKLRPDALQRYQAAYPPIDDRIKLPPAPPMSRPPEVDQAVRMAHADEEQELLSKSGLAVEKPDPDQPPSTPFEPQGIIMGYAIAIQRLAADHPGGEPTEMQMLKPGDVVEVFTISGQDFSTDDSLKNAAVSARFVVCDYFKSEMSEYDANIVFVPFDYLQKVRTMQNRASSIQIKLKDYRNAPEVMKRLRGLQVMDEQGQSFPVFPEYMCHVMTWEDKQGPLLGAIAIEKGLLNVLLFLIIAVAGFGILAIFSMIVTEKTRDIGIIKALGASNGGVMTIFLGYGLLLGIVGAGLGTGLGLTITIYINEIEKGLTWLTGQQIFDRTIYYFKDIPTDIQTPAVLLVNLGSIAIAVLFSVLPALRAALLHPVRALRYE